MILSFWLTSLLIFAQVRCRMIYSILKTSKWLSFSSLCEIKASSLEDLFLRACGKWWKVFRAFRSYFIFYWGSFLMKIFFFSFSYLLLYLTYLRDLSCHHQQQRLSSCRYHAARQRRASDFRSQINSQTLSQNVVFSRFNLVNSVGLYFSNIQSGNYQLLV